MMKGSDRSVTPSAWSPLRQPLFRGLWIATVASNIGTWMHDVGAAWLMISLTPSLLMVALVQAATSLPMFFLAIPAGALADIVDRRRLLLVAQAWMLLIAAVLGLMTIVGAVTPWLLLALTFALGMGTALNAPAWQSIIPEIVSRSELPSAVTLNGVAINISRAVGPAVGGLIIAAAGPQAVFLLNAVSFLGVVIALVRWRRSPQKSRLPVERILGAMHTGIRYVRHAPFLKAVLVRAGSFIIFGSALWALLPLVVRAELERGPATYGVLLGCLGLGAILATGLLPRLRQKISVNGLIAGATVLFAVVVMLLGFIRNLGILSVVLLIGGASWITLLSSFNTSAQRAVPSWVRGRALSVYLLVFFGGMAGGSALWGKVAELTTIPWTLAAAATGIILVLPLTIRYRLVDVEGLNLAPSMHWPAPMVVEEPQANQGPVTVMVEYRIDPAHQKGFLIAMEELRQIRRRDGAIRWDLLSDPSNPNRYIELFIVETWVDHLRQHERFSISDREVEARVRKFHIGDGPPVVSHLISERSPSHFT